MVSFFYLFKTNEYNHCSFTLRRILETDFAGDALFHSRVVFHTFNFVTGIFVLRNNNTNTKYSPYQDPFLITAQVLSIFAFLISWIFWGAFWSGFVAMLMLQILYCCRQNTIGLTFGTLFTLLASGLAVFSAVWILLDWDDAVWCAPYVMIAEFDDNYYKEFDDDDYNECPYEALSIVAFVCAGMWFVVGALLLIFVCSGRHKKLEAKLNDTPEAVAVVELGQLPAPAVPVEVPVEVTRTSATASATTIVEPDIESTPMAVATVVATPLEVEERNDPPPKSGKTKWVK